LVSSAEDGEILIWHTATGRPLYQLDRLPHEGWGLLLAPDRSNLAITYVHRRWEFLPCGTFSTQP
jgi:hypothetical protein